MKKYFIALLAAAVLVGCQKSMSTDEISEKAHSGVVLIINYYYYSVTLPNGQELFFNGIEKDGFVGLTTIR